jgi:hypothetical protein
MSTPFLPTFENGGFWEYYKDLERQFENYLEHVPYLSGNESTYSFRLANLILSTGAHIDSAFKEIANNTVLASKYPLILKDAKGNPRKTTIWDYFPLAIEYDLPKLKVLFKRLPSREDVLPFQQFQKVSVAGSGDKIICPDWWNDYNQIKHQFSSNLSKATLKTARDTLAAAFLLNVVHIPAARRLCEFGLVRDYGGEITLGCAMFEKFLIEKKNPWNSVETPLFVFLYHQ